MEHPSLPPTAAAAEECTYRLYTAGALTGCSLRLVDTETLSPATCHSLQLSLEECTHLETAALRSRRMQRMSLGTCPRLGSIAIDCETMEELVRS